MSRDKAQVVVAGHICLDVIPQFPAGSGELSPGALLKVGPAIRATGGAVANTGLALHRLGFAVRLAGKVGSDPFGQEILDILRRHDPSLADGMIVSKKDASSYSIVISPPGKDRTFLHCPGANDTLASRDFPDSTFAGAKLLHFGYPPLMRRMYLDDGRELRKLFSRAKAAGLTTSLDMAEPDASSEAGKVDWCRLLRRVLPHVDLFVPSIQEILYMADRSGWREIVARHGAIDIERDVDAAMLRRLSKKLLEWGATAVMIKLGDQGAYLRTTADLQRFNRMGACKPKAAEAWLDRELAAPCFKARVVGTTGSGDCAIAGLLAGVLKGMSPDGCLRSAVAVGAASVEAADATSGVPRWRKLQARLKSGWEQARATIAL